MPLALVMIIYRLCPEQYAGGGDKWGGVGGNFIDMLHKQTEIFRVLQHVCKVFKYGLTQHNFHCECYYRQYIFSLFPPLFFYLFRMFDLFCYYRQ
jgi:hypothetical protein